MLKSYVESKFEVLSVAKHFEATIIIIIYYYSSHF